MSGPRAKPFDFNSVGPDATTVTRIQAARQQLDSAIGLYFISDDLVSRHTLLFAAVGILNPMIVARGGADLLMADKVAPEFRDRWLATLRQSSNFFKHGKKESDPNDTVTFRPSLDELTLTATIEGYGKIAEHLSENMVLFVMWIRRKYPTLYAAPLSESEIEMQRRFPEGEKLDYFRYAKWILSPECQGKTGVVDLTRGDVEGAILLRMWLADPRSQASSDASSS